MDIGLHIKLNRFINIDSVAGPALMFCGLIYENPALVCIALIVGLIHAFIWLVVRYESPECTDPECGGHGQVACQRISFWQVESIYTCDCCGKETRANFFNPNFEVSIVN